MAEEPQEQIQEQQPQKKKPLWGFIASDPELTFTSKGDARFYLEYSRGLVSGRPVES